MFPQRSKRSFYNGFFNSFGVIPEFSRKDNENEMEMECEGPSNSFDRLSNELNRSRGVF